jgi:hypothetical protein
MEEQQQEDQLPLQQERQQQQLRDAYCLSIYPSMLHRQHGRTLHDERTATRGHCGDNTSSFLVFTRILPSIAIYKRNILARIPLWFLHVFV